MGLFHRSLFILAHTAVQPDFYPVYRRVVKNQWRPYTEMKEEQEKQLRHMIQFCYDYVPYYRAQFKTLKLQPHDIRKIEDLQNLPVLTKDTIKQHWEEFKPSCLSSLNYYSRATGGSTGSPLQYRLSKPDRFLGGALLYRGWGYGGFELGDKMVFLAGSSLDVSKKSHVVTRIHEISRNIKKFSSFDMGDNEMQDYACGLNSIKPRFIRGYASSIFFYASWLDNNSVSVPQPHAIFTTAEKLFPHMRKKISDVFGCEVYDTYGLNDGGISAYECAVHNGLHIDTERSILEITDVEGIPVYGQQGTILATSLHNYAMPFLRYNTGDLASLHNGPCACGRESLLLQDIIGREKEFLITPSGRKVHGAALFNLLFYTIESSVLPDAVNRIKEFQIIQRQKGKVEIVFACDGELPAEVLDFIHSSIKNRFNEWDVEFRFVDEIDRSRAGKFRFIINEMAIHG